MKTKSELSLKNVLAYERDIKPEWFIQLYSGVGSGKNEYFEFFLDGNEQYGVPRKTILLITSRKAKVDEVVAKKANEIERKVKRAWSELNRKLEEKDWYLSEEDRRHVRKIPGNSEDGWGECYVYQKSVICTNAFIEQYFRYIYNPSDTATHLWHLFDIIVVDEVHSTVLDATYQSAPFYVKELINEYIYRRNLSERNPNYVKPKCERMVLMTGTPDAVHDLSIPKDGKVIDLMDVCLNVQPKEIHFITKDQAIRQIENQLTAGERIIYFQNHTDLPEKFCDGTSINPADVAVSFTKQEKRDALAKSNPEVVARMNRVEQHIQQKNSIPKNVKLFLTTSRNKEGINLMDKDIKHLYAETLVLSDLVQIGGRVREGVDHMYIVVDAKGFNSGNWKIEEEFDERIANRTKNAKHVAGLANQFMEERCRKYNIDGLFKERYAKKTVHQYPELESYVKYIHEKFPYVRYCYIKNYFMYYDLKKWGRQYQAENEELFASGNAEKIEARIQQCFPDAKIHPYTIEKKLTKEEKVKQEERAKKDARIYLESALHGIGTDVIYTQEEYDTIIAGVEGILNTELKQPNSILKRICNLQAERVNNDKKTAGYSQWIFLLRKGTDDLF